MGLIERLNEWGTRDTERGKQLYKDIQDAIQQLNKMQYERDELLAALKLVHNNLNESGILYADTVVAIKSAIAKADLTQ